MTVLLSQEVPVTNATRFFNAEEQAITLMGDSHPPPEGVNKEEIVICAIRKIRGTEISKRLRNYIHEG